jgi:hypothetical protein
MECTGSISLPAPDDEGPNKIEIARKNRIAAAARIGDDDLHEQLFAIRI